MFDLMFLAVVGLSTAFAALRGGLREFATLLSLAIAAGLTWLVAEPLLAATGLAGSFFGSLIIIGVLVGVFFILAHIACHIGLKHAPLQGRAKLIDRLGGGAFGFFRGLVLVGLGYLGYSYYLDESRQPESVTNAVTLPMAAGMANWFETFAPESSKIETITTKDEEENAAIEGYGRTDRNGLEEIVTTVTTTESALSDPTPIDAPESDNYEDAIADILIEEDE